MFVLSYHLTPTLNICSILEANQVVVAISSYETILIPKEFSNVTSSKIDLESTILALFDELVLPIVSKYNVFL